MADIRASILLETMAPMDEIAIWLTLIGAAIVALSLTALYATSSKSTAVGPGDSRQRY